MLALHARKALKTFQEVIHPCFFTQRPLFVCVKQTSGHHRDLRGGFKSTKSLSEQLCPRMGQKLLLRSRDTAAKHDAFIPYIFKKNDGIFTSRGPFLNKIS